MVSQGTRTVAQPALLARESRASGRVAKLSAKRVVERSRRDVKRSGGELGYQRFPFGDMTCSYWGCSDLRCSCGLLCGRGVLSCWTGGREARCAGGAVERGLCAWAGGTCSDWDAESRCVGLLSCRGAVACGDDASLCSILGGAACSRLFNGLVSLRGVTPCSRVDDGLVSVRGVAVCDGDLSGFVSRTVGVECSSGTGLFS